MPLHLTPDAPERMRKYLGHPPHHNRDSHPNRRNALTYGGAAAGAREQLQAGVLNSPRSAGLPTGPHGPLRAAASLHRRERV